MMPISIFLLCSLTVVVDAGWECPICNENVEGDVCSRCGQKRPKTREASNTSHFITGVNGAGVSCADGKVRNGVSGAYSPEAIKIRDTAILRTWATQQKENIGDYENFDKFEDLKAGIEDILALSGRSTEAMVTGLTTWKDFWVLELAAYNTDKTTAYDIRMEVDDHTVRVNSQLAEAQDLKQYLEGCRTKFLKELSQADSLIKRGISRSNPQIISCLNNLKIKVGGWKSIEFLPNGWTMHREDSSGDFFFIEEVTGKSQWDFPARRRRRRLTSIKSSPMHRLLAEINRARLM